ncbi:hypothetical protein IMSAGC020_02367 [Lachnospiraceae bacterium]|nr:hypothetical protein IMSAGC020_02367 [Lachnospiraceae bacterium]
MNDIASKHALIVCEKCIRDENENDIDFSTRLLSIYNSCYENIDNLIKQENAPILKEVADRFLNQR